MTEESKRLYHEVCYDVKGIGDCQEPKLPRSQSYTVIDLDSGSFDFLESCGMTNASMGLRISWLLHREESYLNLEGE